MAQLFWVQINIKTAQLGLRKERVESNTRVFLKPQACEGYSHLTRPIKLLHLIFPTYIFFKHWNSDIKVLSSSTELCTVIMVGWPFSNLFPELNNILFEQF